MADATPARVQKTKQEQASAAKRANPKGAQYRHPFPSPANPLLPFSLVALLSNYIWPPEEVLLHPLLAFYDVRSQTIRVTDEQTVKALWTRGFYGKGSLSRSEPSWWVREQNRRGHGLALTSEEVTAIRREERREFKQIKAKERLAAAQAGVAPRLNAELALPSKLDVRRRTANQGLPWSHADNAEHLQLESVDAFYLIYALGSLQLFRLGERLSTQQAFQLFQTMHSAAIQRDNDFLVKYAAYHHFRSLGWVVRSGIKFCTDFILYKGADGTAASTRGAGPPGGHAEFSVIVVKRFKDAQDPLKTQGEESLLGGHEDTTWKWLSTVNRVTSGVKKTLILAYVTIPTAQECTQKQLQDPSSLSLYNVREVVIRRFLAARLRD